MTRRLFIHAGAHRTGTTSFQLCLEENKEALRAAGFDATYPNRDGIKSGGLRLRLPHPRHGHNAVPRFAPGVADMVGRANPDPARALILSEENIPGRMLPFQSGKFYPVAERRLETLRAGLGAARVEQVLFVIRRYDQLYVSAYRKRAEENPAAPFSQLRDAFLSMDRGWSEILAAIHEILRPERLLVVPYEARGSSVDLLRLLCPDLAVDLQEPERRINLSATDMALQVLQGRMAQGEEISPQEARAVMAAHQDQREDLGIAGFSEEDTAALAARYAADTESIQSMPFVTWAG